MTSPDILSQSEQLPNAPMATSWDVDDIYFDRAGLPPQDTTEPEQATLEPIEPNTKPWVSGMTQKVVDIFLGRNGVSQ